MTSQETDALLTSQSPFNRIHSKKKMDLIKLINLMSGQSYRENLYRLIFNESEVSIKVFTSGEASWTYFMCGKNSNEINQFG